MLIYWFEGTDQAYELASCRQLRKRRQQPLYVWLLRQTQPGNREAEEQWRLELPNTRCNKKQLWWWQASHGL